MAVLKLADVKSHLNITTSTDDGELQTFIDAAVAALGERVGPLEPTARTVRVRSFGTGLRLPGPAVSITTVTDPAGNAVTVGDLHLETTSGLVDYLDGQCFSAGYYTVAYMAGRTPVPDDLILAAKELVRHFWMTQRGPTRRPGSTASDGAANTVPGAAYMLPFRVSELIKPHIPIMVGI